MSITKHMSQFENVPFRSLALICPISASGSNFGTLVKLQRYPRNTTCITDEKLLVVMGLRSPRIAKSHL